MSKLHQLRWCFARKCTHTRTFLVLINLCCFIIATSIALMITHYWYSEMTQQLLPGRCTSHDCVGSSSCCCDFDFVMAKVQPHNRSVDPFTQRQCHYDVSACDQGIWSNGSKFGCWATIEHLLWFSYPNTLVLNVLAVLGNVIFWTMATTLCCCRTQDARIADLPDYLWRDRNVTRRDSGHMDAGRRILDDSDDLDDTGNDVLDQHQFYVDAHFHADLIDETHEAQSLDRLLSTIVQMRGDDTSTQDPTYGLAS